MTQSLPDHKSEPQWNVNDFWPCIMENPAGCAATLTHNRAIGHLSLQKWLGQECNYVEQMSGTRASTTSGLATWNIQRMYSDINP